MTDLAAVSLFDGIGGFPEAFRRAGVRTVATCEIDKAAAGVTAEHFPDAAHFSDVTELKPDDLIAAGFNPGRGVVSAGWPCTDLSLAGLRLGLGGARSGLVGEVFRILAGLRPRWVVLENVPGLLSSVCPCPGGGTCADRVCAVGSHVVRGGACGRRVRRGRYAGTGRCMALHGGGMGTVLGALVECGYGVAYRVLDAQYFGVPQRRRRVVIVGCLGDWASPVEVLFEPEGGGGDPAARGSARPGAADSLTLGTHGHGAGGVPAEDRPLIVTALTSNMAGGGGGADDNTAQGGHLIAAMMHTAPSVLAHHGRNNPGQDGLLITHALTAEGADASEDETGRGTPLVPVVTATLQADRDRRAHHEATLIPTGFAEHGTGGSSMADGSPSVRTGDGGAATMVAEASSGVRRLMPVECERLQGYPDGWTAVSGGRDQADAPRYRQLGNSIAVPVFEWVARRIVAVDENLD